MTPLLATTSTPQPVGTGTLVLLGLAVVVGYLIACAVWPFKSCRRCDGTGKLRSPSGRAWRTCPRCRGRRGRLRAGRRLFGTTRDGE